MTASEGPSPLLAVVVTVLNEGENILPVCKEIRDTLAGLPATEVLFVDDGSTDDTRQKLLDARARFLPGLRILTHPIRLGKSTALRTAIRAANAPWIATMDGDGQDDPGFIKTMFEAALAYEDKQFLQQDPDQTRESTTGGEATASQPAGQAHPLNKGMNEESASAHPPIHPEQDEAPATTPVSASPPADNASIPVASTAQRFAGPLVVGIRRKRQDNLSRKLATRFANGLRRRLLKDDCPDTGAPLKLFRRELFLALPQFEGLHRFIPALMKTYGAPLLCIETQHRPRLHGHSKYSNFNRALVGIRDLLGVIWLQNRTRPLPPSNEL